MRKKSKTQMTKSELIDLLNLPDDDGYLLELLD